MAIKPNNTPRIIEIDPWLKPVAQEVTDRYERFINRLTYIESNFKSIVEFASAYKWMGIHYSAAEKF